MTEQQLDQTERSGDSPLVTVYITNYNYEEYIRQAIESVLDQNFRDFELSIIDDGSTDGSREIIREYADHEKTRVIFQENKGLNQSINVALKAARGKYVMRLDADDYLDSNALLVMVQELEEDDDLALVFPDYYYVDENGEVTGQERRHDFEEEVTVPDRPAHGACTLFRKRVLEEVGSYCSDYTCQDGYDIWLKVIGKYSVKNVNLPLFYYRRHGENLTENEEHILNTRSEIKEDYVRENGSMPNVLAVVPVRGEIIDPQSPVLEPLGEKPLLEWTLKAVEEVKQVENAVVSTPDPNVIDYVKEWDGQFEIHERSPELARENVSLKETLTEVFDHFGGSHIDALAQIVPHTPFRTTRAIEEAITTLEIFPVDQVIGVIPEDDKFYFHDGSGLQPVSQTTNGEDLRLERERLFRRAGGVKIIDPKCLQNQSEVPKIGHVILHERESFEVRNETDISLARELLAF